MRRRTKVADEGFWVSFTDLVSALLGITLLLLVTVVLFHTASVVSWTEEAETAEAELIRLRQEAREAKEKREALRAQLVAQTAEADRLYRQLYGRERSDDTPTDGSPRLELAGDTLFASGSSALTPEGAAALLGLADKIRVEPRFVGSESSIVVVQGYTDSVQVRQATAFRSNWHLSADRAARVVEFLIKRAGLPAHRIAAAGFSQYYARQRDPDLSRGENNARNRYVKLVIIERSTLLDEPASQTP